MIWLNDSPNTRVGPQNRGLEYFNRMFLLVWFRPPLKVYKKQGLKPNALIDLLIHVHVCFMLKLNRQLYIFYCFYMYVNI